MCSIYVGGGGGGGELKGVGWRRAAGGEKDTCQERKKNGKMINLEIKSSSPEEMKELIVPLPLVDCTYLARPPTALGSLLLLNVPIRQALTLLPMYITPRYVFEDGFIVQQ